MASLTGEILVILRPTGTIGRAGLEIVILDRGKSIDPAAICGRDLADIRPGGLGVHIIRSVMDKVQYRRRSGGGMLLRMVKYAAAQLGPARGVEPLARGGRRHDIARTKRGISRSQVRVSTRSDE